MSDDTNETPAIEDALNEALDATATELVDTTKPYHKRFRRIDKRVVKATRDLAKEHPWRYTDDMQLAAIDRWLETVCAVYDLSKPAVVYDRGVPAGNGVYFPDVNTIVLPYFSMLTLLYMYRRCMQHQNEWQADDEDTRSWALSLFRTATPHRFERMVREGRVQHLTAADL